MEQICFIIIIFTGFRLLYEWTELERLKIYEYENCRKKLQNFSYLTKIWIHELKFAKTLLQIILFQSNLRKIGLIFYFGTCKNET